MRSVKLDLDRSFSSCSKRSLSKGIVRFTLSLEMSAEDEEIDDDKDDEDEMSMVDLASSACLRIFGIPVLVNKGINRHDHNYHIKLAQSL